jgi:hypothetical protein
MGTLQGMELKKRATPANDSINNNNNNSWTRWLFQMVRGAVALGRDALVQTLQVSFLFCRYAWSNLVQPLLLPWSSGNGDGNGSSSTDTTTTNATRGCSGDGVADQPRRRHHRED